MQKIIQISDKLFWGYNMIVNLDNYISFDELCLVIKQDLLSFLHKNNLMFLKEEAEKLNLHTHNFDNYEDLYKTNENVIYLCNHC